MKTGAAFNKREKRRKFFSIGSGYTKNSGY